MKIGDLVEVKGHEELGLGIIEQVVYDDEYPVYVHFLNQDLHESENSGCFEKELIISIN